MKNLVVDSCVCSVDLLQEDGTTKTMYQISEACIYLQKTFGNIIEVEMTGIMSKREVLIEGPMNDKEILLLQSHTRQEGLAR